MLKISFDLLSDLLNNLINSKHVCCNKSLTYLVIDHKIIMQSDWNKMFISTASLYVFFLIKRESNCFITWQHCAILFLLKHRAQFNANLISGH